MVEAEDTGVGISPEQLGAIFERFRRVGDTLASKPEGAGLGLPISREIVQHHGGALTAQSQPGRGSCFRMTLPTGKHVVDTTGAGDVYHGALLAALLWRWPISAILNLANAVAALECRRLGGQAGIPTLAETRPFLGGRGAELPPTP